MSEPLREQIAQAYRALVGPHTASDGGPLLRMPTQHDVADAVLPLVEAEIERVARFGEQTQDELRARVAELEAVLREVLDAILTPSDPDSDQLPVPEQTTEAPEHPDPERWPGTTERPWFVEGLTAMDRFRSRVIFFVGDSDQDRADLEMIVEAVNAYCPSAWTPEVEP